MQTKNVIHITVVVGLILLVPFLVMQFSDGVDWDMADFVVMGVLLFGAGLALEFVVQKLSNPVLRVIVTVVIVVIFLLIWAELAVGIFGTPWAGS